MKAMVKATGEIVNVTSKFCTPNGTGILDCSDVVWVELSNTSSARTWKLEEIECIEGTKLSYWDELMHRAAIAAMQGILANPALIDQGHDYVLTVCSTSVSYAEELIGELQKREYYG